MEEILGPDNSAEIDLALSEGQLFFHDVREDRPA